MSTYFESDDNDIYFMDVVQQKIIANFNYDSMLIFDMDLTIIKQVPIKQPSIIYASFADSHGVLLVCPDNGYFLYLDVETGQCLTIPLGIYCDLNFMPVYEIVDCGFYLISYNGDIFRVNKNEQTISRVCNPDPFAQRLHRDHVTLKSFNWLKVNNTERCALIEQKNGTLQILDYDNNQLLALTGIEKSKSAHDFDITNGHIVQIGESECIFDQQFVMAPDKNQKFLRGKIIHSTDGVSLVTLSRDYTKPYWGKIERWERRRNSYREIP